MLLPLLALILAAPDAVEPAATLGFVGDISFAGRADAPAEVFAAVRAIISAPDLTLGNAEGLLLENGAPKYSEARLDISADPRYAAAFEASGIDLIGLANNHSWDAGARGLLEHLGHFASGDATFGAAGEAEVAYAPQQFKVGSPTPGKHTCFAFVPATLKSNRAPERGAFAAFYGRGGRDVGELVKRVIAERDRGCLPVVYIHWGREAKPQPDAAVITLGHELADAGAALVIGHHPHVLQGVELRETRFGQAVIAWSLGNFVFKNRDADKRRTGMLRVGITPLGPAADVSEVMLVPMTIDAKTFAPRPATDTETTEHLRVMRERSKPFGTSVELVDGRLVFSRTRR